MTTLIIWAVIIGVCWALYKMYWPKYRRTAEDKSRDTRIGQLKRELGPDYTDKAIDEANEAVKKEKLKLLTKLLTERNL